MSVRDHIVVSYGGGVNSVAVCVWLAQRTNLARFVRAIIMADPGSERRRTTQFRDEVMQPWLAAHGLPQIIVVNRIDEGRHRPRAWRLETLEQECLRIGALPSAAFGRKKCSAKYKAEPQRWWLERQPWAQALWARGGKITKVLGYDAEEGRRAEKSAADGWKTQVELDRFQMWFPLFEAGLDREACERLIADAGLPSPGKSACTYCPNNTLEEWEDLRREEPEAFARAVAMSRTASSVSTPDVVGLMRCNEHGKRQLHVWADGGYGTEIRSGREDDMPCECAT